MGNILKCDSCKKYFISSENKFGNFCHTCIKKSKLIIYD